MTIENKEIEKKRQEVENILKNFSVDVIIRRRKTKEWVAVETSPPVWISSVKLQNVKISTNAKDIRETLEKIGVEIKRTGYTVTLSYKQFKKLVGMLLIDMFTKTFSKLYLENNQR